MGKAAKERKIREQAHTICKLRAALNATLFISFVFHVVFIALFNLI